MTSLHTSGECNNRAEAHLRSAHALLAADEPSEWAAVALFYAAYHRARAAILDDPVFGDASALARINPKLTMEDRMATHHEGRRSSGGHRLGVTEIVASVYPVINGDYRALHQASIQVRYGAELIAPLADLRSRSDRIEHLAASGALVAVNP